MHYAKLIGRSLLFIAALVMYIANPIHIEGPLLGEVENMPILMSIIWMVFIIEMIERFFPSKLESMGCQKQFKRNYNICFTLINNR